MVKKTNEINIAITPPNFEMMVANLEGISPFVQRKFSEKSKKAMQDKHAKGSQSKKGTKREPRIPQEEFEAAQYKTTDGKNGIPAPAFRNAMIKACSIVGFKMTQAKMGVFIEQDDIDPSCGMPLVYVSGKPNMLESTVRLANGSTDLCYRPIWYKWSCKLRIRYDADMFSLEDVSNLLARAGLQVGVGEGRPASRMSSGQGWGMFKIG